MAEYRRQVAISILWQGGGQILGQTVSWVATLVVIRLLSQADYGLMAMANVFLGFLLMMADMGVGAAAVQAREVSESQLRKVFGFSIVTTVGGFILTFAGAPLAAWYFQEPRVTLLLQVLSVNFLLIGLYVVPQAQLVRELNFKRKAAVETVAMVISAGTSISMAALGFGVWALVGALIALQGSKAVLFHIVAPARGWPDLDLRGLAGLLNFSVLTTLDRVVYFGLVTIDILIVGRLLGTETLGLYAVAVTLSAAPLDKVMPAVTQVSFAAFSRIQNERERVKRNVLRSLRFTSLMFVPAFLGLAVVAPDLIALALGERWSNVVLPFQLICLSLPVKAVFVALAPAVFGIGQPRVNLTNTVLALVGMGVAFLIGVQYGLAGVGVAWLVGVPVFMGIGIWRCLRALEVPLSTALEAMSGPTAAGILMAATVTGLHVALPESVAIYWRLPLEVLVGVLAYTGLVWITQRPLVEELRASLRPS